jgi:hypothetical protein
VTNYIAPAGDAAARAIPGAALVVVLLSLGLWAATLAGTLLLGRGVVWIAQIRDPLAEIPSFGERPLIARCYDRSASGL